MADEYKTPVVRFRDPRIAIENKPVICIDQGAEAIDVRRAPATTYTENTLTFSELSTGGTNMCIDRKIKIEYEYYASLSASGTATEVLYGTNTSYAVTAGVTAGQVTIETAELANAIDGPPYIPKISAADRTRNGLNGILVLCGLDGPRRNVGPRALGLSQSASNIAVTINGNTVSTKASDYINAIEWYGNHGDDCHMDYSGCASYPDLFKSYKDGHYKATNPLNSYGSQLGREPRGAFWSTGADSITSAVTVAELTGATNGSYYCIDGFAFEVVANGATPTIGKVKFIKDTSEIVKDKATAEANERPIRMVEPLLLPLFNHGNAQGRSLYGVNKFTVDYTMSNITKKWFSGWTSKVDGKFIGDKQHSIVPEIRLSGSRDDAHILYNILTPKDLPDLPLSNAYQCNRVDVRQVDVVDTAVGGTITKTSGNITCGSIPERIYIWIAQTANQKDVSDTDTFCRIDKLSFQFNSSGYQFSSASTEQLYHMARESGLKMSLPQWRDQVGSVCCINFAKDVNMGITDYPGLLGNPQFTLSIEATKLADRSNAHMKLYIAIVEQGMVVIKDQMLEYQTGSLQINPLSVPIHYRGLDTKEQDIYGGMSFDDFKKHTHSAASAIQKGIGATKDFYGKHKGTIQKGISLGEKGLAALLPLLAAGGISEDEARFLISQHGEEKGTRKLQKMLKKRIKGSGQVGGSMIGGKQTSKKQMSRFLYD